MEVQRAERAFGAETTAVVAVSVHAEMQIAIANSVVCSEPVRRTCS